jgi:hypothetical protein
VLFVQSPREEEARIAGSVQDILYSDFIGHALGDMDGIIFPRVGASAGVLRRRPGGAGCAVYQRRHSGVIEHNCRRVPWGWTRRRGVVFLATLYVLYSVVASNLLPVFPGFPRLIG